MITENEKKALLLAKKVFEHFTQDALPIAREIIAMEHDLGEIGGFEKPINGKTNPIPEGEKKDGQPENKSLIDLLTSDLPTGDLRTDHETSLLIHHHTNEMVSQQREELPF